MQDIQKGQDFGKLASQFSEDTNTKSKGGNLDWLARYQYSDSSGLNGPASVANWIFDPGRYLNQVSPVLNGNGAYYIVQIMNVDPSRAIDATLLKSLQANALIDWLQARRALPGQNITNPDQNKLFDANNLPQNNILPANPPAQATPAAGTGG